MATAAKKKRTKKTASGPRAGKRVFRFDRRLGCTVEVTKRYDAKAEKMVEVVTPVKAEKSSNDWLKPRQANARSQGVAQWPMVSNNFSFNKKQIPSVRKLLESKGVKPPEFDKFNRAKFTDRRHKRECLQATGRCDLDAGYSDAVPKNYRGGDKD